MPVLRTLLAFFAFTSLALADHELRTLGGKTIKGNVIAITPTEIVQQGEAGEVKTPLAQVLTVDLRPAGKPAAGVPHTLVRLIDDSILRCNQIKLQGKDADLTLLSGQTARVPVSAITWFLKEAQDKKLKDHWDELLALKVKRDRIAILSKGKLNPLPGTIGEVDKEGKTVPFTRESGEVVDVDVARIHGMIFYRTESPPQAPNCTVIDTEGNTLSALKVSVEGGKFIVHTPAGFSVTMEERLLAKLDYNRGKLTYLADMEPVKREESSLDKIFTLPQRGDAGGESRKIVLAGKDFTQWFTLHAYTALEYDLDGKYKDFKAELGCTAREDGEDSQALVTIECDGQKKFSKVVSAKAVEAISLSVRDVRRLRIVVSTRPGPHDFLNLGAYATLADARVSQ
jgi:hypothetical protein